MKLNLGCGNDIKEGYVNVDFRQTHPSVMLVDLSVFPWPFGDASADEILMLDFLEHFPYAQTERIILECYRVLKPDGTVVVQVPDGEHLMHALTCTGKYLCNRCGYQMEHDLICRDCGQTQSEIAEAAMMRLYGGQDFIGNFHHTCFTRDSLMQKARSCGLKLSSYEEEEHQFKNWNFKARFRKDDPWGNV